MARVPRRTGGPPRVPLSPEEEHLLKVVDGVLDVRDLTLVTGTDEEKTLEILERLAMIGLVALEDVGDDREAQLPPPSDPADDVDLTQEERTEIETFAHMLGRATFYELLGLGRDAVENDIKRAYYRLAPKFHPDRHFGKDIGPYKPMIEAVFSALTKAHDTLRYAARREKYDEHLPPMRRPMRSNPGDEDTDPGRVSFPGRDSAPGGSVPPARGRMPSGVDVPPARGRMPSAVDAPSTPPPRGRMPSGIDVPPARGRMPSAVGAPSTPPPRISQGPDSAPTPPPRVSQPPGALRASHPVTAKSAEEVRAERDALARKLAGQKIANSRKAGKHATEVKTTQREAGTFKAQTEVRQSATEAMRARFDTLGDVAKEKRLKRYLEQAQLAMVAEDYRAAVAAFEQAVRITPDDPELLEKLQAAAALAKKG